MPPGNVPVMGGRRRFAAAVCLVALVAASCAEGGARDDSGGPTRSAAPAAYPAEVEELCAAVADAYENAGRDPGALSRAEEDLAAGLREVDAPADVREGFDAYVAALEEHLTAQAAMGEGASLDAVVASAKVQIRLDEAARAAGLPDECPPPPSVDVDNNLFVAKANRECSELIEEVGGEPFDPPRTPEEVALLIDIARRLTARIAGAVADSETRGVQGIPVSRIVRLNEKRMEAIDALAATFEGGDYAVYRKAGRKLMKISRRADRTMLSSGLVLCAKAFDVVPL
jgi:hypothetical protein